jgi:hypothetical protein
VARRVVVSFRGHLSFGTATAEQNESVYLSEVSISLPECYSDPAKPQHATGQFPFRATFYRHWISFTGPLLLLDYAGIEELNVAISTFSGLNLSLSGLLSRRSNDVVMSGSKTHVGGTMRLGLEGHGSMLAPANRLNYTMIRVSSTRDIAIDTK